MMSRPAGDNPGRPVVRPEQSGGPEMSQKDLRLIDRIVRRLERDRVELEQAIVKAHLSGETMRDIGKHAKMGHQRIQEIVRKQVPKEDG